MVIFILINLDITLALLGASLDNPLVPKALANNRDIIEHFLFVRIDKNLYVTVQSKLFQVSSSDLYCSIKLKLAILHYFTEIQINTIILLKLNVTQNMNYGLPATTWIHGNSPNFR